ncbi:hypothetical protein [Sphingomonas sp. MMS24-J13]|uniref:hypothetical protein n=1 Tax=Sphingomonas sp. MMS24-J13 TaxID=3238686 RepID=UPI00384FB95C
MTRWPAALLWFGMATMLAAEPPKAVSIDAATMRKLSVTTAPVQAMTRSATTTGFARVLDPIPLAQLDADIAAAGPAAFASAAEAKRSRDLFAADATISRKAAETATMQARADGAKLALLRRRLGLEWGPAIARLGDARRAALVEALSSGRAALVRIDSASGTGQAGLHSVTLDLGDLGTVNATILGPARAADPRLQSPGLIAQVAGPKAGLLSTGLSVPAKLSGIAVSGSFVPGSAVLRLDGASWVYRQTASGTFGRIRLPGVIAVPGGLFVRGGIRAGDRIATSGAAALYAAEHGGHPVDD